VSKTAWTPRQFESKFSDMQATQAQETGRKRPQNTAELSAHWMRFCNCSKSRLAQAGKESIAVDRLFSEPITVVGFPQPLQTHRSSARFRAVRQEARPPPEGGSGRSQVLKKNRET